MEDLGQWMLEHPRATRCLAIGLVAISTWEYLKILWLFTDLDHLLAQHASDAARAASEALGG